MTGSPLKSRATEARALARATKAWTVDVTAAAAGTRWRPTSSWIQQSDGTRCVELTHVSTGKCQTIRLARDVGVELLRAQLVNG